MMTTQDRIEVGKAIAITAVYYGQTLDKGVISLMVNDLSEYNPDIVLNALKAYRLNAKNIRYPTPAALIEIINARPNNKDSALVAAGRVREAIRIHGYVDPDGARNYIGELGWRIIRRFGGWQYLCENLGVELSEQTFFAQFRDLATAEQNVLQLGHNDYRPALLFEGNTERSGLVTAGEIIGVKLIND